MTDAARSASARMAALTRHAMHDPREATRPARVAWEATFAAKVDPEGVLSPTERATRAERAKKAHMMALSAKAAKARKAKAS